MGDKAFVVRIVEEYLEKISKKAIFIKHPNHFPMDEVWDKVSWGNEMEKLFHDYEIYAIKDAYEPFMSWIRQAYYNDFADQYTVEEFVENCGVYSLQREVFCSYITHGVCERKLEVMMNEYDYEEERVMESIYSSLRYIANDKIIILVISKLHMAPDSVLHFLNYIFDKDDNIRFIFTYSETFLVKEYCKNEWLSLMNKAEERKLLITWEDNDIIQSAGFPDEFEYKEEEMETYIPLLTNMVHLHAFQDAKYYFHIINTHVFRIGSNVCDSDKFRLLELLGMADFGMEDYKDALLVCEKMVPLLSGNSNVYREYIYNYFSAKAHLLMAESNLTRKFCAKCRKLAEKLEDELLMMNVDIIETVAEFGSLKELFRCNYSYRISENVIERAKKFGNENFLAYMYIFGYDNDEESVRLIGTEEKEPVYFHIGIEMAEKLGNKNLLLNAYMKNIILYSNHGFYKYVRKMYQKRLQIVDKDNSVRVANMYVGLGYNTIVLEDYVKADEYFRKGLEILIEKKQAEGIAETLYNMFINYFTAGSNEQAIECIELALKVMEVIHIQGLRMCNISKIYGILALAHYKTGQYLDCYYFLGKMEAILSYVLNKNNDEIDELWWEDLFLYHLCQANIFSYRNDIQKAKEHFDISYQCMNRVDGVKFYSYSEYAISKAAFLKKQGLEKERSDVLNEAYEYCISHDYPVKASRLKAELENMQYDINIVYSKETFPVKEIMDVCQYVGSQIELEKREKDIDFLTLCHDIMVREESGVPDVVNNTMNLIRNTFSFDRILFIERTASHNNLTFSCENINMNNKDMNEIYEFFNDYKVEFMSNRIDKSFTTYRKVIEKFGVDDVATIIGVPIFSGGLLTRMFVATIDVHRGLTKNRNLLDKNNLEVIKCAISQLDEAIRRIKNSCIIRLMNAELEKAAVTDRLTGIYNRMGFDKILSDNIADTGVLLYMDLDDFKKYNDTYGHNTGDVILKGFADIIRDNIKNIGYAIRYGGDEFVVVIPGQDEKFAEKIAENIQKQLREDYSIRIAIDGQELASSIGVARYESADREGFEIALKMADQALYFVKNHEKGNVVCWSKIRDVTD